MNLNQIREGELNEVFDALEDAFDHTGTDFYLIGAVARDVWFSRGKKSFRGTKDVDIAVLVGSRVDYEAIKEYLKDKQNFIPSQNNSFAMQTATGIQVDILPFGEIEIDSGVEIAGTGLTSINVNGFKEVYASGTEEVVMETGHNFKIASLPSIVLLKFIAFDDRPEIRSKDARDIANIILHYFDLQADLIYTEHNDLFIEDTGQGLEEIAAIVLGRQIKKIASPNELLLSRIQNILKKLIEEADESVFVINMAAETNLSIEENIKLLENILSAL